MKGALENDRLRDALNRSRSAGEERREVADALFREHLDLAAIRKALGQPLANPIAGCPPDHPPTGPDSPAELPNAFDDAALTEETEPVPSPRPGRRRLAAAGTCCGIAFLILISSSGSEALIGELGGVRQVRLSDVAPDSMIVAPAPLARSDAFTPLLVAGSTGDVRPAPGQQPQLLASVPDAPPPTPVTNNAIEAQMSATVVDLPAPSSPATILAAVHSGEPEGMRSAPLQLPRPESDLPPAIEAFAPIAVARAEAAAVPGPPDGSPKAWPPEQPARAGDDASGTAQASTRVVVHFHRAPSASFRTSVSEALRRAGFERVEWRMVAATVSRSQTRFFHTADEDLSRAASRVVSGLASPVVERDFTFFKPPARAGTIELWLAE